MERRSIGLIAGLFILIVIGMFVFAYLKNTEIDKDTVVAPGDQVATTTEESPYSWIDRVEAKHFYTDGEHTFVGLLTMPTPCDLLETGATVAESMPEQVTLQFTVVNNAETCAQVLTEQRFRVSVEASEGATFSATLEGRPIELNLIEALPDETPDDFELFIKG